MEHEFPFGMFCPEKTGLLFLMFRCSRKFSDSRVFFLTGFSETFCGKNWLVLIGTSNTTVGASYMIITISPGLLGQRTRKKRYRGKCDPLASNMAHAKDTCLPFGFLVSLLAVFLVCFHLTEAGGKTLVLLDNSNTRETHSIFFNSLKGKNEVWEKQATREQKTAPHHISWDQLISFPFVQHVF